MMLLIKSITSDLLIILQSIISIKLKQCSLEITAALSIEWDLSDLIHDDVIKVTTTTATTATAITYLLISILLFIYLVKSNLIN